MIERKSISIRKMTPSFQQTEVEGLTRLEVSYEFPAGPDGCLKISPGKRLTLKHDRGFECTSCGRKVKKLFDGYCFPCLKGKAEADQCVMSPHKCHFLTGTCREPAWGLSHCFQPHAVYLSFTDKFKVGITRLTNIPTRWIDQGATMAAVIAEVRSRHQAGVLEKFLTATLADKSHWLKMLQAGNRSPGVAAFAAEWVRVRDFLLQSAEWGVGSLVLPWPEPSSGAPDAPEAEAVAFHAEPRIFELRYPLDDESAASKWASASLEKAPEFGGEIQGIKGQYLLSEGRAFNVRRHEGFLVDLVLGE